MPLYAPAVKPVQFDPLATFVKVMLPDVVVVVLGTIVVDAALVMFPVVLYQVVNGSLGEVLVPPPTYGV